MNRSDGSLPEVLTPIYRWLSQTLFRNRNRFPWSVLRELEDERSLGQTERLFELLPPQPIRLRRIRYHIPMWRDDYMLMRAWLAARLPIVDSRPDLFEDMDAEQHVFGHSSSTRLIGTMFSPLTDGTPGLSFITDAVCRELPHAVSSITITLEHPIQALYILDLDVSLDDIVGDDIMTRLRAVGSEELRIRLGGTIFDVRSITTLNNPDRQVQEAIHDYVADLTRDIAKALDTSSLTHNRQTIMARTEIYEVSPAPSGDLTSMCAAYPEWLRAFLNGDHSELIAINKTLVLAVPMYRSSHPTRSVVFQEHPNDHMSRASQRTLCDSTLRHIDLQLAFSAILAVSQRRIAEIYTALGASASADLTKLARTHEAIRDVAIHLDQLLAEIEPGYEQALQRLQIGFTSVRLLPRFIARPAFILGHAFFDQPSRARDLVARAQRLREAYSDFLTTRNIETNISLMRRTLVVSTFAMIFALAVPICIEIIKANSGAAAVPNTIITQLPSPPPKTATKLSPSTRQQVRSKLQVRR